MPFVDFSIFDVNLFEQKFHTVQQYKNVYVYVYVYAYAYAFVYVYVHVQVQV